MQNYDVIIVGGGPTGVALAIELGMNNISTLILEKHNDPMLSPRAQLLNARTMEFFMRWKLYDKMMKKNLLPPNFPIQGIWCSKLNGIAFGIGNMNGGLNDELSPARAMNIPLWITEEVLRNRLADFPKTKFLKSRTVLNVTQHQNDVEVKATDNLNQLETYHAQYVIACDGANSLTRKQMNIGFEALNAKKRLIHVMFQSTELKDHITIDKGLIYYILDSHTPAALCFFDPNNDRWYIEEKIEQINLLSLLDDIAGFPFDKKIISANF